MKRSKNVLIFMFVFFLVSCAKTEYVYIEPQREPITCHQEIQTYLDMAKCLEEYKVKYND